MVVKINDLYFLFSQLNICEKETIYRMNLKAENRDYM